MSVDIPLMRWCSEYFVRAGGLAYFGDVLGTIAPALAPTFIAFDDLSCINTNTRKTAFWMLTYRNPSYIEPLRKETTAAFNGDRLVDLGHIHKNCPLLKSLWFETLRMASNATSVRLVNKDTIIGNKILRKGNRIRPSTAPMSVHLTPSVLPVQTLRSSGGPSAAARRCAAAAIAKRATLILLSIVLRRFDIVIVGEGKLPTPDLGMSVLGIMAVKDD
ncbi:hypothetical protein C8Q69DRAFT_442691 [Paecilomyces variotii]|uniref:Uncharacterized protein n=1 Tax=Byssochlamys spectabilis TaxID=264951 RepID=A0A443I397_BYSSP|nr:hypothetical protein C8Q69DRAFT_442691 [Paecilomyces variotii]RWQ98537.1 hypothetical protein C8Q69DRAFT_442691 [Paecilomyces variotii]